MLLVAGLATPVAGYDDGAPDGHTGGFDEPDCTACHADNDVNDSGGRLTVQDFPAGYRRGETYRFSIVIEHAELQAAGVQVSLRDEAGRDAGRLAAAGLRRSTAAGVSYLTHDAGIADDKQAAWQVEWQAPADGATVLLHVAANAANGDRSALGDFVYRLALRSEPIPD